MDPATGSEDVVMNENSPNGNSPNEPETEADSESNVQQDAPGDESSPLSADDLSRAFAALMGEAGEETEPSPNGQQDSLDNNAGPTVEQGLTVRERVESDDDETPVSPLAILEAMLFVGHPDNSPLPSKALAACMRGVSPSEIDEMVLELNQSYIDQQAAYHIISEAGGYRMALCDDLNFVRNSFYGKVKEVKLSQSAIDVLSLVAYNQPAERKAIDKLFGKPAGSILGQLVRRDLLRLERTEGRPRKTVYHTTDRFLRLFGLESVDDLPRGDDF